MHFVLYRENKVYICILIRNALDQHFFPIIKQELEIRF
jgi:hypothetical protein